MEIAYEIGDATAPQSHNPVLILHCCNDLGRWGAGFVLALSKRWRLPEAAYLDWSEGRSKTIYPPFKLGAVQSVQVEKDIFVANMIGQHGIGPDANGLPPVRYDAIELAMDAVAGVVHTIDEAYGECCEVHCPRFGAGLAGGDWEKIEDILLRKLVSQGILVTVYDLPAPAVERQPKIKLGPRPKKAPKPKKAKAS